MDNKEDVAHGFEERVQQAPQRRVVSITEAARINNVTRQSS